MANGVAEEVEQHLVGCAEERESAVDARHRKRQKMLGQPAVCGYLDDAQNECRRTYSRRSECRRRTPGSLGDQPRHDREKAPHARELAGHRQPCEGPATHHRGAIPVAQDHGDGTQLQHHWENVSTRRRTTLQARVGGNDGRRQRDRQRPATGTTPQHADDQYQQNPRENCGEQLAADPGIARDASGQGIQQNGQRHVASAGVVLAVEERRIQLPVSSSFGRCYPDTLHVRDAIVVTEMNCGECEPSHDHGGRRHPQRTIHDQADRRQRPVRRDLCIHPQRSLPRTTGAADSSTDGASASCRTGARSRSA